MKKLLTFMLAVSAAAPLSAQIQVDTSGAGALVAQAMDHSEVMQNLQYLSDAIGPRLSGSAAMRKSNDWVAERFRAYGLAASLESYSFGVTWERGPISVNLVSPFRRALLAYSWAWTEGTGGRTVSGPVVRVSISNAEDLEANRDRIRGAWVMLNEPSFVWNPDGPAMTAADSAARRAEVERRQEAARAANADTSAAARERRQQFGIDRPFLMKKYGALGTITDGSKEHTLVTMSGSPNRVSPLPNIVVSHEDYLMLARQVETDLAPRIEATIDNRTGTAPVEQWNTIGEIRGTERPGQVVILGAHLDSWDHAQGVTDNGASSMAVVEAARIIARSGLKPKRTIRFILFSGEEQGLLGSRAYAAAHAAEADSIQAVMVLDNGTGMILGQALQGRNELEQLWTDLLAPVAHLGAGRVRQANKGGTDHLSFVPYGVPAFNFDQEPRGYNHTHHSQSDTFDKAIASDLRQASAVMAVTAFALANLPELLPRGEKRPVTPSAPAQPSPGLAAGR
ncbi:MAG TPA: M20/M25/M40 family metallo-hydrolase [Gemmatimonadales bacterium]